MDAEQQQGRSLRQTERKVFLVNAVDNPDAKISEDFAESWSSVRAPSGWKPGDGLDAAGEPVDAVIVFTTRYREREARKLCESIRETPALDGIPLLVAVNQFQMPLANRVRKLPLAGFVFTPLQKGETEENLSQLSGNA